MLNLKPVAKQYGDYICRRCINKVYHVKLEPQDCAYGYFYECPRCQKERHIVVGLRFKGHLKMLFK